MKKVLLYLWQLPQNILGLLVILVTGARYNDISYDKSENFWWAIRCGRFGVSLGEYIIFGPSPVSCDSLKHEQGHQKQSQILGPLYLILIGIPSFLWNIITRLLWIFSTKKRTWLMLLIKLYYHMPWEYTADKLGGVER
jgi:hypothetical protein